MLSLRRFRPLGLGALAAFLAACLVPLSPSSCFAGPLGETAGGLLADRVTPAFQGIGQVIDPRGTNLQIDTFAARRSSARSMGLSLRADIPVRGIVGMTLGLMGTDQGMILTQYGIRCSLAGHSTGPVHIAAVFGAQFAVGELGSDDNPFWAPWAGPLSGIAVDFALGRRAALQTMLLQNGGSGGFQHLEGTLALGGVNEAQFRVGYRRVSIGTEPAFEGLFIGIGSRLTGGRG